MCTKSKVMDWVTFTTETGLKAKYKIVGEDLRNDVRIKILTSMPKGYYHSALNQVGVYYDEHILPTLIKPETRGGADRGQGRKNKYGEETTTFSCRVPVSKKDELSTIVAAVLKQWLQK